MRTGEIVQIYGRHYSVHSNVEPRGWVPCECGRMYDPTEEDERFNSEHFVDVEVEDGQWAYVLDEYCRKTGLREDDGSSAYMDKGTVLVLHLLGGDYHGFIVTACGEAYNDVIIYDDLPDCTEETDSPA
jgi:hypothetical protein